MESTVIIYYIPLEHNIPSVDEVSNFSLQYGGFFWYSRPKPREGISLETRRSHTYTVSQLTQEIKDLLEEYFIDIWVEGEVSNVRIPPSGHIYFTLKDQWSQMRAVIFKQQAYYLRFIPEDGLHIICRGRVSLYERRGEYQLILDHIEPKGVGALQIAFEQLKNRLEEEGLFDEERKRPLPLVPRRIGMVTSPSGAAIRDMLQIIHRRFPNVEILIDPVRVQGFESPPEIEQAVRDLNALRNVDVIIVGRGGGSLEDLWAFNDERVARAIYESRVPIISAVGHETDFTIADFVADVRAPTPSAAAELVVREKAELLRSIQGLDMRMVGCMRQCVGFLEGRVDQARRRLVDPRKMVERFSERLNELSRRLPVGGQRLLVGAQNSIDNVREKLLYRNPRERIKGYGLRVSQLTKGLSDTTRMGVGERRNYLGKLLSNLDNLSPLAILKRGYSITRKHPSDEIVKDAHAVKRGDKVKVKFYRGGILCEVEESGLS
jgi:exodeoxyribonuclease VII large subunit